MMKPKTKKGKPFPTKASLIRFRVKYIKQLQTSLDGGKSWINGVFFCFNEQLKEWIRDNHEELKEKKK